MECWPSGGFWLDGDGVDHVLPPDGLGQALSVATGYSHSCAVLIDSTVSCWGEVFNSFWNLPPPPDLPLATAVFAGPLHSCLIAASSRAVTCWGGKDGDGNELTGGAAIAPAAASPAIDMALGWYISCVLRPSRAQVFCWGTSVNEIAFTHTRDFSDQDPVSILAAGQARACVVLGKTRSLQCWLLPSGAADPALPSNFGPALSVAVGSEGHACAVKASGEVLCWGDDQDRLNEIKDVPADFAATAVYNYGEYVYCALAGSGTVRCWGIPVRDGWMRSSAGPPVITAATALYHGCAITRQGAAGTRSDAGGRAAAAAPLCDMIHPAQSHTPALPCVREHLHASLDATCLRIEPHICQRQM